MPHPIAETGTCRNCGKRALLYLCLGGKGCETQLCRICLDAGFGSLAQINANQVPTGSKTSSFLHEPENFHPMLADEIACGDALQMIPLEMLKNGVPLSLNGNRLTSAMLKCEGQEQICRKRSAAVCDGYVQFGIPLSSQSHMLDATSFQVSKKQRLYSQFADMH